MFENLSKRLNKTLTKLSGLGKIRESNVEEAIRDVKLSLLEADVNYKVVGEVVDNIKKRAVGAEVLDSLTPYQHFVGIVNQELTNIFEAPDQDKELKVLTSQITVHMLVGLQGSGKTTTAGKLARYIYKNHGFKPLLVPIDTKRPAAIDQLDLIGKEIDVPTFISKDIKDPVKLAQKAMSYAKERNFKCVIFDTAGRLHIDDELMKELSTLEKKLNPHEVLFVADSMTGQDAVNSARGFSDHLGLTGIILTKIDGDARGGAALSIVSIAKKPIKFMGIGEKFDALEVFHPDRVVSRILGMGDVVTLFEKTKDAIEEEEILKLEEKIRKKTFTIEDFRDQLKQINKMGSLESILKLVPGMSKMIKAKDIMSAEGEFKKINAMINSMTIRERNNHAIINGRRRSRIARGSGTTVQDINRFLKQFMQTKKMMQRFSGMNPKNILKKGLLPF